MFRSVPFIEHANVNGMCRGTALKRLIRSHRGFGNKGPRYLRVGAKGFINLSRY